MMRLLSIQGLQTKSKPALLRYIIKHLRRKSKRHLVMIAYNISKSKLPQLRKTNPSSITGYRGKLTLQEIQKERKRFDKRMAPRLKPKRKFSRKQLAAQRLFAKRARAGTLKRRRR